MPELLETLTLFETLLNQAAPTIAARLQPGLSLAEIEAQTAGFSWFSPEADQRNSIDESDAQLDLDRLAQIYRQHCTSN